MTLNNFFGKTNRIRPRHDHLGCSRWELWVFPFLPRAFALLCKSFIAENWCQVAFAIWEGRHTCPPFT